MGRRRRRLLRLKFGRIGRYFRRHRGAMWTLCIVLVLLTLASRISIAYFLASDEAGDGVVYARLARNMLEQGVYSVEEEAPFSPTFVRVPGYPLFLSGVYSVFGHDNNTAVRVMQGVIDTGTCVLAALI